MSNFAMVKVPKTGTTTVVFGYQDLWKSEEHPCLSSAHWTISMWGERHGDHSHDFFTWVRDPLQMYCSSYYFLKNRIHRIEHASKSVEEDKHPLYEHSLMLQDITSLEEYLLEAPANDFMPKYFGGSDLKDYVFVGKTEEMSTSLQIFTKITGLPIKDEWRNKNPKRPETLQPYYVPADVAAKFKKRNYQEYEAHAKGLELFEAFKRRY